MSAPQSVVDFAALMKANFRRTMLLGGAVGVVGLGALVLAGHPALGVFGCVGILLGLGNAVLIRRFATAYGEDAAAKQRLALSIAVPLVATLVIALVVGIVFAPNGIAVFGGLMIFQVLMMASTALPLLHQQK